MHEKTEAYIAYCTTEATFDGGSIAATSTSDNENNNPSNGNGAAFIRDGW